MGENSFAEAPTALYGAVLLMAAGAYRILEKQILRRHDCDTALGEALRSSGKELVSLAIYAAAIPLAFVSPLLAGAGYVAVAVLWAIPDPRIERALEGARERGTGAAS